MEVVEAARGGASGADVQRHAHSPPCAHFAQVWSQEQKTLLLWIDALWSCFLEDVERLKKAVYVKVWGV